MSFDIIYNIMRDAAHNDGIESVLQRLVAIASEGADTTKCSVCHALLYRLCVDLDAARVRFVDAVEHHDANKRRVV